MGFNVLKESSENSTAREELKKRGLDFTSSGLVRILRKLKLVGGISIGDVRKSWDVLKTVEFIRQNVKPDARILDFGSYASEILPILHRAGYTALKGVDLNPNLKNMPYSDKIYYCVGNFMDGTLSGKFDVVTAISVIEHGYREGELIKVLTDLVAPAGFTPASSLDFKAKDAVIDWMGKKYTFAWFALKRAA